MTVQTLPESGLALTPDPAATDELSPEDLAEQARIRLHHRSISRFQQGALSLTAFEIERSVLDLVRSNAGLSEMDQDRLIHAIRIKLRLDRLSGPTPILLTDVGARRKLSRLLAHDLPGLAVLSHSEIPPGARLQKMGIVEVPIGLD